MPETPRWLAKAGRDDEAVDVLRLVYGGKGDEHEKMVRRVARRVEKEIEEEQEAVARRRNPDIPKNSLRGKIASVNDGFAELIALGVNRRALIIACMLQGFQQLCGFNSLMYFSATIFSLLDFTNPTLPSLSIALTNFAFTLVAFHAIDRIGRRRILLLSIPVMVVGLALCSLAFGFLDLPTHEAVGTPVSSASSVSTALLRFRLVARNAAATSWPLLILLSLILYVASYALGLGNVPWQQSELFALPVRALGSAAATATNWGANCLVGLTFLPLMHALSPAGTFALYAGVCVVGW
ncbi:hypothetical protein LTR04_004054, partial [Oleoguttula sp. CCFEE 6159]